MKKQKQATRRGNGRWKILALILAPLYWGAMAQAKDGSSVLEDHFNDLKNWSVVDGDTPTLVDSDPKATHTPYLSLANGVIRAQLRQTLKESATVRVKILHTAAERGQWVALMNEAGTQGYGFRWDSTPREIYEGKGFVSIIKLNLKGEPVWGDEGDKLVPTVNSGHLITEEPFAEFEFTWNKSGRIELKVDGVILAGISDKDFSEFSRVYIRGNTFGLFDDLVVSGPEQASEAAP